jgi:hypothetical protein
VTDLVLTLDCDGPGGGGGGGAVTNPTAACPPDADGSVPAVTDIADSVHRASIECLLRWGIARPGSTFRPSAPLTRGQAAAFLARILDASGFLPAGPPDAFDDDDGHVFEPDLDALAALGVVTGDDDGAVHPDDLLTRAQLAAVVVRSVAVVNGAELPLDADRVPFPDVSGALADAVNRAAAAGLVVGRTDGTFGPSEHASRGQVATILVRVLDLLVTTGHLDPPF